MLASRAWAVGRERAEAKQSVLIFTVRDRGSVAPKQTQRERRAKQRVAATAATVNCVTAALALIVAVAVNFAAPVVAAAPIPIPIFPTQIVAASWLDVCVCQCYQLLSLERDVCLSVCVLQFAVAAASTTSAVLFAVGVSLLLLHFLFILLVFPV